MRKYLLAIVVSVLATVAVGCSSDDNDATKDEDKTEEAETITVEHELDTTEVEKNPEKVVVFDFGSLDTLNKLDVEVAGLPQATVPEYLKELGYDSDDYENVGSLKEPDFEKIAEIDPDLIIISGRQGDLYDQLEELAPTVYLAVDNENYMESFESNVQVLGEIFEKEAEAEAALEDIKETIAGVNEEVEATNKDGLIILANDDKISAYGPGSRFGIIHDVFGVPAVDEGIEVATHGQNVSFEYVGEQDPDLLYVVDRGAAIGEGESAAELIVENKLMERTKAMKNDDIYYLDPDFWYLSGGGLISVEEMVHEIEDSIK